MITNSQSASAIFFKSACVSIGSGVVNSEGIASSPIMEQTVPISPTLQPASSKMDLSRKLVVVLPFVPVMPIRRTRIAGCP